MLGGVSRNVICQFWQLFGTYRMRVYHQSRNSLRILSICEFLDYELL